MKHKLNKGFTIIEVVLVLAIAGLIFLTVFLAIPALQRSFRDNARKQDARMVIAAIRNKFTNSRGRRICDIFNGKKSLDGYVKMDEFSQVKNLLSFGSACSGGISTGFPAVSSDRLYDTIHFDVGGTSKGCSGEIEFDNSNKIVVMYNLENKSSQERILPPGMYFSYVPPLPGQPEPPKLMGFNTCIEEQL